MKRIFLAMTILALFLPALAQVEARTDVSIDFFYDNLGDGGNWVELADYGYCWQPSVAVSNANWRPYTDGYWAYTDVGWTWVSYEDFGWATYHYGRWTRLRDRGWFWVPGREWGPAWVSWRTGGDQVGWAPLPPRGGGEVVYEGRPITSRVDVEFDIGPLYYNFVDVRYIGEPVLRERIYAPDQNVLYITKTVNVTNITYRDSLVYNHGPDYDTLSRYSTRPIQRLTLQRDTNVDLRTAAQSGALTRVQGDRLMIAAPQVFQKPAAPVAPKVVKEKIAKTTIERGWSGDARAQAEIKEKMKAEDPKNVAPPSVKPREGADTAQSPAAASPASAGGGSPASAAGASPGTTASPAVAGSPAPATSPKSTTASPAPSASVGVSPAITPGKGKGRERGEGASPAPSASVGMSPAVTPGRGKGRDRGEAASPAPSASVGTSPATAPEKEKNKRGETPNITASPATAAPASAAPSAQPPQPERGKQDKGKRDGNMPLRSPPPGTDAEISPAQKPATSTVPPSSGRLKGKPERDNLAPAADQPPEAPVDKGRGKRGGDRGEVTPGAPPISQAPPERPKREAPADGQGRGPKSAPPAPAERLVPPPDPAANAPVPAPDRAKPDGGKKKKGEPESTPVPQ